MVIYIIYIYTRHNITCIRNTVLVNMPIENVPWKNNPGITPESFPGKNAFFLRKRKRMLFSCVIINSIFVLQKEIE